MISLAHRLILLVVCVVVGGFSCSRVCAPYTDNQVYMPLATWDSIEKQLAECKKLRERYQAESLKPGCLCATQ